MNRTEMDILKPYTDFSETRQWKCFVHLKVYFINFNKAILSHVVMCAIPAPKMPTSVEIYGSAHTVLIMVTTNGQ
jgi:hypothetical protein